LAEWHNYRQAMVCAELAYTGGERFGHWILEFEIYLRFGAWNLGFKRFVKTFFMSYHQNFAVLERWLQDNNPSGRV
jgi:hypothetical protein